MLHQKIGVRKHRAVATVILWAARRVRRRSGDRPASIKYSTRERIVRNAECERLQACGQFVADEAGLAYQHDDRSRKHSFGGVSGERIVGSILKELLRRCNVHGEGPIVRSAPRGVDAIDRFVVVRVATDKVARVVRQYDDAARKHNTRDLFGDVLELSVACIDDPPKTLRQWLKEALDAEPCAGPDRNAREWIVRNDCRNAGHLRK